MAEARLRILFVINSLILGGAQRQLLTLAAGLKQRGHDVSVAVFRTGGIFENDVKGAGIRVIDLRGAGPLSLPLVLLRLAREVRAARIDVVHSYLPAENVLTGLLRFLSPGTRVVWGVRASEPVPGQYGRLAALTSRIERRLSRLAHRVVFNSRSGMRAFAASGFAVGSAVVIPNGLDTREFRPDPVLRGELRRAWGIPDESPLVGIVARLDPMKDYETFLGAAAQVAKRDPAVRFVSVSQGLEGEYGRDVRDLARRLGLEGRMQWHAARSDMPAVYNALDLLVLSSSGSEGFSNALAEAMACGKACVCTDVGDGAYLVGDFGIVVPPGDAGRLAEAILRAIGERGRFPANAARERIERHFDQSILVEETEAELLRVAAGRRAAPALAT